MKRANTVLDFISDSVSMLGREMPLYSTESGHYFVPLGPLDKSEDKAVVLLTLRRFGYIFPCSVGVE